MVAAVACVVSSRQQCGVRGDAACSVSTIVCIVRVVLSSPTDTVWRKSQP